MLPLGKDFVNLKAILDNYQVEYDECKEEQNLDGKTMHEVCVKTHAHKAYYDERGCELKHIYDHMEIKLNELKGKLYQGIKKGSNITLGPQEISKYVESDPEYVKMRLQMLEVKEMYDKFSAASDAFRNIGFQMKNLTALKVAQLEDTVL